MLSNNKAYISLIFLFLLLYLLNVWRNKLFIMACTTILVGKGVSYDGSTLISRNDDAPTGVFEAKRLEVVSPSKQPRIYKSKIAHLTIELPDNPLSYTAMPSVDDRKGIWAASGINSEDVAMTATETITSNPLVLGADPMVDYKPAEGDKPEVAGGIGEEDLVAIVLPYIHSAKEGVLRLGALLEKYGTYESNGIAFSDKDSIWWLESIGGHHWIARRVDDDEVVIMPNQFGLDRFDFDDAYGEGKNNLCSKDLKEFIEENHLDLNLDGHFNPRLVFGSYTDSDHVYNTPRAWYLLLKLNKNLLIEGNYQPESDDIPWAFKPAHKVSVEDIKYLQASHYQGTKYDCYARFNDSAEKGKYRPIGISRTCFMSVLQVRGYAPEGMKSIEWIGFASNVFNTLIPFFTNTDVVPSYLGNTTLKVDTNNLYWSSRLVAALADAHFNTAIVHIERYQEKTMSLGHQLINKYDKLAIENKDAVKELIVKANQEISDIYQKETDKVLSNVLYNASCLMKNGYSRSDN